MRPQELQRCITEKAPNAAGTLGAVTMTGRLIVCCDHNETRRGYASQQRIAVQDRGQKRPDPSASVHCGMVVGHEEVQSIQPGTKKPKQVEVLFKFNPTMMVTGHRAKGFDAEASAVKAT